MINKKIFFYFYLFLFYLYIKKYIIYNMIYFLAIIFFSTILLAMYVYECGALLYTTSELNH